jgi:hypothetical protein
MTRATGRALSSARPRAYNRAIGSLLTVLSLCGVVSGAAAAPAHFPARPSPEHVTVFAPPGREERFRFLVTEAPIDEVARFYRERAPQGAVAPFLAQRGGAAEAFDSLAPFNRFKLAQLYGGQAPLIARGPVALSAHSDEVAEVVLLMSPYPEADLRRLNPGTLIMVVSLGNADRVRP